MRIPPNTGGKIFRRNLEKKLFSCLLFLCTCFSPVFAQARTKADLILKNGAVYTVDRAQPWAEAVALADGKIIFVGKSSDSQRFQTRRTRLIDLHGKMVLPGFHDSHVHLLEGGIELGQCTLNDCKTPADVFAAIRTYAAKNGAQSWIVGGGWELPVFPGGNPTREDLDKLVPDRPAYFNAADGHSAWANTRALQLAGITALTPDPEDGRIERKPGSQEPSGTLREAAMDLFENVLPKTSAREMRQGLRTAQEQALRQGITSIIDARTDEPYLDTYLRLDRQGELKVKVQASVPVDTGKGPEQIRHLIHLRRTYQSPHLKVTSAKIFADGVIEAHTAALLSPYLDKSGEYGKPILAAPAFNALAVALDKAGFQIHVHAIGDRAIRQALDAIEAAEKANGFRDLRPQLAHIELIDPADLPRFKKLGVVADFQPLWAYADPYIKKLTIPSLGPERSGRLYQIGSMVRSGAVVAAGSDWTVSSLNPLEAIQMAVTRKDPKNPADRTWLPKELIDLPAAIRAYTINGAYLNHQEKVSGSIEKGKTADIIVLDLNLFQIPPEKISGAKVVLTIIDGKIVFSAK